MMDHDKDDGEFWISFDQDQPKIFGGPKGDVELAWQGPVQFDNDGYQNMPLISDEQFEDLEERLIRMTKFIETVIAAKADLEAQIHERRGQERLIRQKASESSAPASPPDSAP